MQHLFDMLSLDIIEDGPEFMGAMRDHYDPDFRGANRKTLLMEAIRQHKTRCVRIIISMTPNIANHLMLTDHNGFTALHFATMPASFGDSRTAIFDSCSSPWEMIVAGDGKVRSPLVHAAFWCISDALEQFLGFYPTRDQERDIDISIVRKAADMVNQLNNRYHQTECFAIFENFFLKHPHVRRGGSTKGYLLK